MTLSITTLIIETEMYTNRHTQTQTVTYVRHIRLIIQSEVWGRTAGAIMVADGNFDRVHPSLALDGP